MALATSVDFPLSRVKKKPPKIDPAVTSNSIWLSEIKVIWFTVIPVAVTVISGVKKLPEIVNLPALPVITFLGLSAAKCGAG